MIIAGQEKPSLDSIKHFGIRGMKWGRRKAHDSGKSAPAQPRTLPRSSEGRAPTREEQLVGRAVNQGHARVVGPAMAKFVRDIPPHQASSNPAVEALLNRALSQGVNRVEAEAGRAFMEGLPVQFQ